MARTYCPYCDGPHALVSCPIYPPRIDRREELATAAMVRAGRCAARAAMLEVGSVADIRDRQRRELQRRRNDVQAAILRRSAARYTELARLTCLRQAAEVQSYYVPADVVEACRISGDLADRVVAWPVLDYEGTLGSRYMLASHAVAEWAI